MVLLVDPLRAEAPYLIRDVTGRRFVPVCQGRVQRVVEVIREQHLASALIHDDGVLDVALDAYPLEVKTALSGRLQIDHVILRARPAVKNPLNALKDLDAE